MCRRRGAVGRRGAGRRNRWRHILGVGNARVAPTARRGRSVIVPRQALMEMAPLAFGWDPRAGIGAPSDVPAVDLAVARLDGRRRPGYADRLQHADDLGPLRTTRPSACTQCKYGCSNGWSAPRPRLTIAACATDATSSILALCSTPIASRTSRCARFCGRDPGVAVRGRQPANRTWPLGRPARRW